MNKTELIAAVAGKDHVQEGHRAVIAATLGTITAARMRGEGAAHGLWLLRGEKRAPAHRPQPQKQETIQIPASQTPVFQGRQGPEGRRGK